MNILVVGGAGYVGSHTVKLLQSLGHTVWVYDNLSRGHRESVPKEILIEGNISNRPLLVNVLQEKEIEAVMHFAAYALVGESVQHPAMYYQNNIVASLELLEAMRIVGVWRFIFSSTTATYGQPDKMPISEDTTQNPINPYGFTKLVLEKALIDYSNAYGFGVAILRYFNAAGAALDGSIGEDHNPESHLIPIVLQTALGQRKNVTIFGDDYSTPDGTCVRDYVHVDDLASAHVSALLKLQSSQIIQVNLGSGIGYSVMQVVDMCKKVTGCEIPVTYSDRRQGDPACLIADNSRAKMVLSWEPNSTLEQIVQTAWRWHKSHPFGYSS